MRKTVLVTGANTGLGYYTSKHLLLKGYGLVMACRNIEKAEAAKKKLIQATGKTEIAILHLDLADLQQIRKAVHQFNTPLHAIVCNAGIANEKAIQYTKDGFESTFAVNHLGHFLLVQLLLEQQPKLERIWVVSSSVHMPNQAPIFPPADMSDLEALAHPNTKNISGVKQENGKHYVNSKLCNILFTYEQDRIFRAQDRMTVINAFNPGFIPTTGLSRDSSGSTRFFLKYIMPLMRPFMKAMRTGEESGNQLATLLDRELRSGKYFDGLKETRSSDLSYDRALASALWAKSTAWVGLNPVNN